MKAPSRKTITATIFFGFLALFFGAIFFYFGTSFFDNSGSEFQDEDESRGFTFFPFGRGGGDTGSFVPDVTNPDTGNGTNTPDSTSNTDNPGTELAIDRLRLVSESPTAGGFVYRREIERSSLFDTTKKTQEIMRFIEVESGHVYETTESSLSNIRITNTTIPRISEAQFISGDSLLIRYIDPVSGILRTFSASITGETKKETDVEDLKLQRLSGVFLPEDIQDFSINSAGEILYTQTSANGLVAIVTDILGQNKKQIFSSPLSEWKPDWFGRTEAITMTHYPSAISYGATLILNRTTERTSPFISGRQGLDVLMSPDGKRALVSYKTGNTISLFIRGEDGVLVDTELDTFAEKCVWSSDAVLAYCAEPVNQISSGAPDLWYQGVESYSDDVWRINTNDAGIRLLFSPFDEGTYSLDIIDLAISADERFLHFRDKGNQFFWTYQLEL